MAISYLNGSWQSIEEARVPVLDRGFMFGDGIYEVIPVYAGRVFTLARHLHRLNNSLAEIKLTNPMTEDAWSHLTLFVGVPRGFSMVSRSHQDGQFDCRRDA